MAQVDILEENEIITKQNARAIVKQFRSIREKPQNSRASLILDEVFKMAETDLKSNFRILMLGGTG